MALLPPSLTHLVVRWIHVLGMATLFGGAVLCWGLLRRDDAPETNAASSLRLAATYEGLFWAGAGLVVLTGVGNLGAVAPAIPAPGTSWGTSFSVKLLGVVVLLVGSLARTVGVLELLAGARAAGDGEGLDRLRTSYAATALLLLGIVALAEVLAHG